MEHRMAPKLVDQERELNLEPNGSAPSMHFIDKVQVLTRKDGLFLVRLFSEAPLNSKEEFRFIGTRNLIRQFAELAFNQLDSSKNDAIELGLEKEMIKEKGSDGSKKKADKKD